MIWGLTLKPGESYAQTIKEEVQLSMAALESRKYEKALEIADYNQVILHTESAEYVLCTLVHGTIFQQYLDMKLMPGEQVQFSVQGKYEVHLTGYSSCMPEGYSMEVPTAEADLPSQDGQTYDSGWQPSQQHVIKQEPIEVEFIGDDGDEKFSKPAVKVPPVQTSLQFMSEQIHQQHFHDPIKKPSMTQRQPRAFSNWQMRGRRRNMPSHRSRGGLVQKRMPRNMPAVNRRGGRGGSRLNVQQGPRQQNTSFQISPNQRVPQVKLEPQDPNIPSNMGNTLQEEISYPIAVQELPPVSGVQLQDLPGSSMSDYQTLGDSLSDPSNNSMQALPPSSLSKLEGTSQNYMPDPSLANIQGSTLMDMPGMSLSNMPGPSGGDMSQRGHMVQQGELTTRRMKMPRPRSIKTKDGGKIYKCHSCSDTYTEKAMLQMHEMLQHGNTACKQCKICKKILGSKSALNLHMRIHDDGKPFMCTYCPMAFRRKDVLRVHERTHSGERPYGCRFCHRTFSQSSARLCHERYQHNKNIPGKAGPIKMERLDPL